MHKLVESFKEPWFAKLEHVSYRHSSLLPWCMYIEYAPYGNLNNLYQERLDKDEKHPALA
jgi:hypothetical protein